MPAINEVRFFSEAVDLLDVRGIDWSHTRHGTIKKFNRYSGRSTTERGIHLFFMSTQDQEVAYFTPIMGTLFIHDTPKTWGKEAFAAEPNIGRRYDYPPRPH